MKLCPNKCGEMMELKKPSLIAPTEDALSIIQEFENYQEPSKCYKQFYFAIDRVCPECGYYEGRDLTEEQFAKANEGV